MALSKACRLVAPATLLLLLAGVVLSAEECPVTLKNSDANKDGVLSRSEFVKFCNDEARKTPKVVEKAAVFQQDTFPAELDQVFNSLKQDGVGGIDITGADATDPGSKKQKAIVDLICQRTIVTIAKLLESTDDGGTTIAHLVKEGPYVGEPVSDGLHSGVSVGDMRQPSDSDSGPGGQSGPGGGGMGNGPNSDQDDGGPGGMPDQGDTEGGPGGMPGQGDTEDGSGGGPGGMPGDGMNQGQGNGGCHDQSCPGQSQGGGDSDEGLKRVMNVDAAFQVSFTPPSEESDFAVSTKSKRDLEKEIQRFLSIALSGIPRIESDNNDMDTEQENGGGQGNMGGQSRPGGNGDSNGQGNGGAQGEGDDGSGPGGNQNGNGNQNTQEGAGGGMPPEETGPGNGPNNQGPKAREGTKAGGGGGRRGLRGVTRRSLRVKFNRQKASIVAIEDCEGNFLSGPVKGDKGNSNGNGNINGNSNGNGNANGSGNGQGQAGGPGPGGPGGGDQAGMNNNDNIPGGGDGQGGGNGGNSNGNGGQSSGDSAGGPGNDGSPGGPGPGTGNSDGLGPGSNNNGSQGENENGNGPGGNTGGGNGGNGEGSAPQGPGQKWRYLQEEVCRTVNIDIEFLLSQDEDAQAIFDDIVENMALDAASLLEETLQLRSNVTYEVNSFSLVDFSVRDRRRGKKPVLVNSSFLISSPDGETAAELNEKISSDELKSLRQAYKRFVRGVVEELGVSDYNATESQPFGGMGQGDPGSGANQTTGQGPNNGRNQTAGQRPNNGGGGPSESQGGSSRQRHLRDSSAEEWSTVEDERTPLGVDVGPSPRGNRRLAAQYDGESAEIYGFVDTPCDATATTISKQDNAAEENCITVFGKYRILVDEQDDVEEVYKNFTEATQNLISEGLLEESFEEVVQELNETSTLFVVEGASPAVDDDFDAFVEIQQPTTTALSPDSSSENITTTLAPTTPTTTENSTTTLAPTTPTTTTPSPSTSNDTMQSGDDQSAAMGRCYACLAAAAVIVSLVGLPIELW